MKVCQLSAIAAGCVLPGVVVGLVNEDQSTNRPNTFKKWRQENPPKVGAVGGERTAGDRYHRCIFFGYFLQSACCTGWQAGGVRPNCYLEWLLLCV